MRFLFFALLLFVAAPLAAQTTTAPCGAFSASRVYAADKKTYALTLKSTCLVLTDTVKRTDTVRVTRVDTVRIVRVDTVRVKDSTVVVIPPTPPDTTTVPPVTGTNKPASYTRSSVLDFSQTPPAYADGDAAIVGAPGWAMYHNTGWTKSAAGEWTGLFRAGNRSDGWGIGNFFTHQATPLTRLYASYRFKYSGPIHPVSNKQLNIECTNGALLLIQLNEGGKWLHQEQLGSSGFWIDNDVRSGEAHLPGRLGPATVSAGVFHTVETVIDIPARTWRVWLDGAMVGNASGLPFACTGMRTIGWNAHRGGGGENLVADASWTFDRVEIAY